MIAATFAELARRDPRRVAIRQAERSWTYAELFELGKQFRSRLPSREGPLRVGVVCREAAGQGVASRVVGLLAADLAGVVPCFFPTGMSQERVGHWSARLGLIAQIDALEAEETSHTNIETDALDATAALEGALSASQGDASRLASLWLFTSGTTGPPQPVEHAWSKLVSVVHAGERYQQKNWLLAYDPASFAGLQVTLQALLTGGTLSDVSSDSAVMAARRVACEAIEFAAGTPTFWRMLLGAVEADHWRSARLRQITLGGEAVSDGTLAALQAAFPHARLSHIYATSELGVCFSVSDGRAGFPAEYLELPPSGCQLRIAADGELLVQSSRRAQRSLNEAAPDDVETFASEPSPADDWRGTGDLVERRANRVYFVGRRSGVIVVGGGKVVPEEIEAILRDVPGVAEARVSAQSSSVLGAILRAEVELAPSAEAGAVRAAIVATCKAQLPRHKTPAMIEFVAQLPRTASGKLARRVEQSST